jgi:Raf kinase inhibitor-like YbhB/YbcL family protein
MKTRTFRRMRPGLVVGAMILLAAGCQKTPPSPGEPTKEQPAMQITLRSEAFADNQPIPKKLTGEDEDVSPELHWTGVPAQTAELALIVEDPDAPAGTWIHWVLYKIPAGTDHLPAGVPTSPQPAVPAGALQGLNSFGRIGYGGPMPPPGHGVHHYIFRLFALDAPLSLGSGAKRDTLLEAMKGHILAEGKLTGTYERK